MNIRSVSNPGQVQAKEKIEQAKSIKSDETADREPNGQQPEGDKEEFHRPLTEEEVERVVEKIRSHEGIAKSQLLVKAYQESGQNIVKIETEDGDVLKRICERELYFYLFQEDKDSLQLVKRAA